MRPREVTGGSPRNGRRPGCQDVPCGGRSSGDPTQARRGAQGGAADAGGARPAPASTRGAQGRARQEGAGLRVGLGKTVGPGEAVPLRCQLPGARARGSGPQKSRAPASAT